MNEIKWLEEWYRSNCNGEWEHSCGIEIGTLDNPGWYVHIDLSETRYKDLQMLEWKRELEENDWIRCVISDGIFQGVGDSLKLGEILRIFQELIEENQFVEV